MPTNRMVNAAKTVIDRAKDKHPTSGVVYGIDGNRVDIRLDNSPAILRHIRVVGDIETIAVNDVIELQWGRDGRPIAMAIDADSSVVVVDNETIELSDDGMRIMSGGIQRHHIGFVLPDENQFADLFSQAGWKINPSSGVIFNSNISISPHGAISIGEGNNVIKMSSYGIPDNPNSPDDDTEYRMWVGHTYPHAAGFALTKYGDLIARKGTAGGWTIIDDQFYSDAGNATLHAGARPYVGMGAALYSDTGFWAGKDTDYIYKVSIGEAGGPMMAFDGSDLTLRDIDLKIYNGTVLTLWIQDDGDFAIGKDVDVVSDTTMRIFSNDQVYNSEAFTAGDILTGDHDGAHVLWNQSSGQLQFRDGATTGRPVSVYIDTDGTFRAAGGDVRIDDTGIMQVSPNSDTGQSYFYWMSEDNNREVAQITSWSRNPTFSAPYQDVFTVRANPDDEVDHYGIILLQTFSNYGTYPDGFFSLNGGTGVNLYWDSKYIIKVVTGSTDVWECEIPELQFQQASTIATAAGALTLSPTTVVQIDTWLELAELNTDVPTTGEPGTGWGAIFVKTDGKVYFKNDGGAEYDLTTGAGGGEWTDDAGGFLYPTETDDQVLVGDSTMVGDDLFNMARANSPTTGTPVYPGMSMWRGSGLVRSRWIGIGTVDNYLGNYLTSNVYYDSGWLHDDVGRTGSILSVHEGSTTSFDFRYMEASTGASPVKLLTIYNDTGGVVINDDGGDRDFRVESDDNEHMLFVDGGQDQATVGTATAANHESLTISNDTQKAGGGTYDTSWLSEYTGVAIGATATDAATLYLLALRGTNDVHNNITTNSYWDPIAGEIDWKFRDNTKHVLHYEQKVTPTSGQHNFYWSDHTTLTLHSLMYLTDEETRFNHGSKDIDFVIESDSKTMFFIDGGTDQVIIGDDTNIAGGVFEVVAEEIQGNQMSLFGYHTTGNAYPGMTTYGARGTRAAPSQTQSGDWLMNFGGRGWESTNPNWTTTRALIYVEALENFTSTAAGAKMVFQTSKSGQYNRNAILSLGNEIVFNEDSLDTNFRVESDNLDDALFMDGATGQWYLGGQSGLDGSFALGLQSQAGTGPLGDDQSGIALGDIGGGATPLATFQYLDYDTAGAWASDFAIIGINLFWDESADDWAQQDTSQDGAYLELFTRMDTTEAHAEMGWIEAGAPTTLKSWIYFSKAAIHVNNGLYDLDFIVKGDTAEVLRVDAGLDVVQVSTWLELAELGTGATPATGEPGSGWGALYVKSDGDLYFKNDSGVETNLTP